MGCSSVSSVVAALLLLSSAASCVSMSSIAPASDLYERCDDEAAIEALAAARQSIALGDDARAVPQLRDVVSRCPSFVPGHLLYQDCAIRIGGSAERAMREYYAESSDDSASPVGPFVRSRLAVDDATRVELLDLALRRDRSFYYAYEAKAALWRRLHRSAQALEMLQDAVAAKADFAPANLALAEVLEDLGRGAESRTYYENYVRLQPGDRDAKKSFVELLVYQLRVPRDASPVIGELLELDPDDVEVLMDAAAVAWLTGDVDRAAAMYRDILVREPTQTRAALNLANLLFEALPARDPSRRLEHWSRARKAYRYVAELNDPKGLFDAFDRYFLVDYRLAQIDAELGADPTGGPVRVEEL